jgi:hypothetical protein
MTAAEHISQAEQILAEIMPKRRGLSDSGAKAAVATAHATVALALMEQEQAK